MIGRRGRLITARLRCPVACMATIRAEGARRRLRIAAGDTHQFVIRTRSMGLRATVRSRSGGRAVVLSAVAAR
jgi:hypothetical protein